MMIRKINKHRCTGRILRERERERERDERHLPRIFGGREGERGGGEGAFPIFLPLIDKADIWNSSPIPQRQEDGGERRERRVNLPARLSKFFFSFFSFS